MKKKSLLTMVVALALVGAVGVGATLAYLSDTTTTLTNTFTVGSGIDISQDESDESTPDDDTDRTEEGNDYNDIQPGDVLVKDPTVTVKANSSECYVFMQVEGADALTAQNFTFDAFNAAWTKVAGKGTLDGVYQYKTTVAKADADTVLEPLFTTVTYSLEVEEVVEDEDLADVVIKSCAVQAAHMDDAAALAAAQEVMNK